MAVVICVLGALFLTPVFPDENAETLAPALVVAGFQLFVYGYDEAENAIRALLSFAAAALLLSLILWAVFLRGRRSRQAKRLIK